MKTSDAQTPTCRWCGLLHGPKCPSVKAIEFEADGITVKRVEFFAPHDYGPILAPAVAPFGPLSLPII
jgi:hypothetical protein